MIYVPKTEGIKYIGSKRSLLPYILSLASKTSAKTVFDAFTGTTRVAQAFAKSGYRVVANDIAEWSRVFGECYLKSRHQRLIYQQLVDHLNHISPRDGWFTEHYGGVVGDRRSVQKDGLKRPWQRHNTQKLDAIREEIDRLRLSFSERAVALTSLILALDRVDNTIGHFCSYLREWSARSYLSMNLHLPLLYEGEEEHEVIQGDVFNFLNREVDLAYFDPPYGSNNEKVPPSRVRYTAYYHIWKTICLNDRPELFGKAFRRKDSKDRQSASIFESYKRNDDTGKYFVTEALERLIEQVPASWIILSYSSGGRVTRQELNTMMAGYGEIKQVMCIDYRRNVMADMYWTKDWVKTTDTHNQEYLFLLKKRDKGGVS